MTALALDPLGRWFQARVNNGVDDAMALALVAGNGRLRRCWQVAHRLHDGRGALQAMLSQCGVDFVPPPFNPRMQPVSFLAL